MCLFFELVAETLYLSPFDPHSGLSYGRRRSLCQLAFRALFFDTATPLPLKLGGSCACDGRDIALNLGTVLRRIGGLFLFLTLSHSLLFSPKFSHRSKSSLPHREDMCEHLGPQPQNRWQLVARTDIHVREPSRTPSFVQLSRDAAPTSVTVTELRGREQGPPSSAG